MIGTILALLCGALLCLPPQILQPLAYKTGQSGLGHLLQSYQLLTYALLHANLQHYAYNMLWLVPSCWYLEERVGKKPLALLCLASAIASAFCFEMCRAMSLQHMMLAMVGLSDPQSLIGASGVASATVAAALVVLAESDPSYAFVSYSLLAGILVCQLGDAVMSQILPGGIAHWGHVGGILMALFFAPSLTRLARDKAR
jgi:membrane associated rhomboid family serine protease